MVARYFLRFCNTVVNFMVVLALLIFGAYAIYALWDNNQVLAAAGNVQADMIKLKPETVSEDNSSEKTASFGELQAINEDVCAWVTMDNTYIDFPVLQGDTNLTYINTDVYGNFALAGSIFLDTRCSRDFDESYALLYGHHMAEGNMFGDLDLYKEETFFRENRTGVLLLPDTTYNLEIIACMLVTASDDLIFDPDAAGNDISVLLEYVKENSLHINEDVFQRVSENADSKLLALSTCSSEFSDARTIVLTVMEPYIAE